MGGAQSETEIDIGVVSTGDGDGGVPHGEAILAFVDAMMAVDPEQTGETRERLTKLLGERGVVDAAAVAAMFQLNTRAADAAGVSVEAQTVANRSDVGALLGFSPRAAGKAP